MPAISPAGASQPPAANPFDHFARFYDSDYRAYDDDLEAIALLAEEDGDPVLELGCGTGRVLTPLAAAGHTVTGVDISPALLALARRKLIEAGVQRRVTLVNADLRTLDLARKDYALAVCTTNTLMHFATASEQLAVLQGAFAHLRPGGRLFIDLFSPDPLRLTAVNGLQELADQWDDPDTGAQVIKWSVRTVDWAEQLQDTLFIYEELLPDGQTRRTACPFTLRFLWRSEAELMLQRVGFTVEEIWGDFDAGVYDATSEHLILLARKGEPHFD